MRIALIVTTYNQPDRLRAVLDGCLAQTDADFEVVVADDGSTRETAELIAAFQARSRLPIRHVWQEDRGFRAAEARNRAALATDAEYLIFTDGDCVPPPQFVAAHRRLASPGWFLAGNRVLLSAAFTGRVLAGRLPVHAWPRHRWLLARLRGDINRYLPLLTLPAQGWRIRRPAQWEGCKTCNLSLFRADFERVNGFDATYSGWGMEDSDLVIRLLRTGVRHKSARFAAPVLHLWHPENDRSRLADNQRRLREVQDSDRILAVQGLAQLSAEGV